MAQLERELRGFVDTLLHGDFMRLHVPEGARQIVDIAFSGNGEPTSAREFSLAIELVGRVLRETGLDRTVKIRLITNGSLLGRRQVQEGLRRLGELGGEAWFKVDAGTTEGYRRINNVELSPESVVRNLRRCAKLCSTWVQTCLFAVDGESPKEVAVSAYIDVLSKAGIERLAGVHLYGLARPSMQPEAGRLSSLPEDELEAIARRLRKLGLTVQVSP
jgi:wyosine [tRNA(Phe)-imidazoG37] synthetase (radical SAM superfamily)